MMWRRVIVLLVLVIASVTVTKVFAQTATTTATSTDTVTDAVTATTSEVIADAATSTSNPPLQSELLSSTTPTDTIAQVTETASSTNHEAQTETATSSISSESSANTSVTSFVNARLTEVHVVGTKYVDYFTDGTTVRAFPGDMTVDTNLNKPDAPIPTHEGLVWDHTSGMDAYDTPSGDLEVNQYARQANGTYIVHYPTMTYTDATSTVQWMRPFIVTDKDPTTITFSGTVTAR